MSNSLVSDLEHARRDLIKYKASQETSADSARLYKTVIPLPQNSNVLVVVKVRPKTIGDENLIVMPTTCSGNLSNIAAFAGSSGITLRNPHTIIAHAYGDETAFGTNAPNIVIYSNDELDYTQNTYSMSGMTPVTIPDSSWQ